MSSSSVCKGLQSCLEPRMIESRILSLKLALQDSNFSPSLATTAASKSNKVSSFFDSDSQLLDQKPVAIHECDTKANVDGGCGWSFLQALTQTSHCNNKTEDQVYVHPTVKRSSSMLSEKSLEMCTESLGCETGSNAGEISDDISLFSLGTCTSSMKDNNNTNLSNCDSKRVKRACNFPPPLTSITDFGGVHVKPRREGGRLILEAFASPSPRPYFHAERCNGRLRLCLLESFSASDSDDEIVDGVEEKEEEGEIEKDKEEEEEEEENIEEKMEDEMGVKKLDRPSRCKESGNRDIFGDALANLSFPLFLSVSE